MVFNGTLTDETVIFFMTNTPCGSSPEDTVKDYATGSGLIYNKVKVYAQIVDLPRDNVYYCTTI